MKYAVIEVKGKQYKVSEGDEILVSLHGEKEAVSPSVLLVSDDKKVNIGNPTVKKAKVDIKTLVEEEKGNKLYVHKYKSKSRYRRKIGFRPKFTRVKIGKITQ